METKSLKFTCFFLILTLMIVVYGGIILLFLVWIMKLDLSNWTVRFMFENYALYGKYVSVYDVHTTFKN